MPVLSDTSLLKRLRVLNMRITYPYLGRSCACDAEYPAKIGRAERSLLMALAERKSTLKWITLRSVSATKDHMAYPTSLFMGGLEQEGFEVALCGF